MTESSAWLSYHHAPMGLTLSYPAGWRLETLEMAGLAPILEELAKDPANNVDVKGTLTFGNQIKLYAPTFEKAPLDVVLIGLEAYRISEEDDLLTLVNLVNEANRLTSTSLESPPMTITRPTLEGIDDVVVVSVEQGDWRSEAIYLAKDGLMFVMATASRDPGVVETMHAMVRSFVFDGSTQALFEQYHKYTVDADVLRASIQSLTPKPQPECDTVCRDAKAMVEPVRSLVASQSSSNGANEQPMEVSVSAVYVSASRKALSANWPAPVVPLLTPPTWNVQCGSNKHTGNAEFAIDVGAPLSTTVYAVADGYVDKKILWDGTSVGYGNHVLIKTSMNIADESRQYYHAYAHLNSISSGIVEGQWVVKGTVVGWVGSSGTDHTHLHFHVRDASNNPVDATPLLGLTPNLVYPGTPGNNVSCGAVVQAGSDPVVIESVAFTQRLHQGAIGANGGAKYWWCINPPGATVECYMMAQPNTYDWFDPLNTNAAPEIQYDNVSIAQPQSPSTYYIWTCGHATDGTDDTIYVQAADKKVVISQQPWQWMSQQFPSGQRPTLSLNTGNSNIRIWMREDGARFGRILLTRDANYNPNGAIRCGMY